MTAATPAPSRPARALVRLLVAVVALGSFLAPASSAAASGPAQDDGASIELVLAGRTVVAPLTPGADGPDVEDQPATSAVTSVDPLVHPDLEPHDGPPPLRGPPPA